MRRVMGKFALMTLPLIVLGTLAVVAGYPIGAFVMEEFGGVVGADECVDASPGDFAGWADAGRDITRRCSVMGIWSFLAGAVAVAVYWNGVRVADRIRRLPVMNMIYIWLKHKMFFDYLFEGVVMNAVLAAAWLAAAVDKYVVDGAVNAVGYVTRVASWMSGRWDTWVVDGAVNGLAAAAQAQAGGGW